MTNETANTGHDNQAGLLSRLFLMHPRSLGESYFKHLRAAFRLSLILGSAAVAAFVHALVPGIFHTTARRRIAQLHKELQSRSA